MDFHGEGSAESVHHAVRRLPRRQARRGGLAAITVAGDLPAVLVDRIEPVENIGFDLAMHAVLAVPAAPQLERPAEPPRIDEATRRVSEINRVVDPIFLMA